jgi:hypothetical protein
MFLAEPTGDLGRVARVGSRRSRPGRARDVLTSDPTLSKNDAGALLGGRPQERLSAQLGVSGNAVACWAVGRLGPTTRNMGRRGLEHERCGCVTTMVNASPSAMRQRPLVKRPVRSSSRPSRATSSTSASSVVGGRPRAAAKASTEWEVVSCAWRLAQFEGTRCVVEEDHGCNVGIHRPQGGEELLGTNAEPVDQLISRYVTKDPRSCEVPGRRSCAGSKRPTDGPRLMSDQVGDRPAKAGRSRRLQAGLGGAIG